MQDFSIVNDLETADDDCNADLDDDFDDDWDEDFEDEEVAEDELANGRWCRLFSSPVDPSEWTA